MKTQRIYVIGTSGSGKTYLAKKISEKLKLKHYDLDDFYWIKKYTKKRPKEKRKELAKKLSKKKSWVAEGIYGDWAIDLIKKAQIIVWLDVSAYKRSIRILKRYFKGDEGTLISTLKLVKYSLKYNLGKHSQSKKAHKELFKENRITPLILKKDKQVNEFLGSLK